MTLGGKHEAGPGHLRSVGGVESHQARGDALTARAHAGTDFDRFYQAHYQRVWAYAARRVGRDDANDVLSETFLVAFRKGIPKSNNELPWLLAIARGLCANEARGARRRAALTDAVRKAPQHGPERDASEIIGFADAFSLLEPTDQEVLMLIAWDGLSPRSAAAVLGCSPATFAVRLHRARRRLAHNMNGEEAAKSIDNDRSPAERRIRSARNAQET